MKPQVLLARLACSSRLETRNRVVFNVVDSTNRVGKSMAARSVRNGAELQSVAILALQQDGGRGRLGRSWSSPRGGIYATYLLPQERLEGLQLLPLRVGVALCREVDHLVVSDCRLKWPNDLMVSGKKIGGILIETVGSTNKAAAIVGFGINYKHDPSSSPLGSTSVAAEADDPPPFDEVVVGMISALESELTSPMAGAEAVAEYARWSKHIVGQTIRCRTVNGTHEGTFLGFDETGMLRLASGEGEQHFSSGDILE